MFIDPNDPGTAPGIQGEAAPRRPLEDYTMQELRDALEAPGFSRRPSIPGYTYGEIQQHLATRTNPMQAPPPPPEAPEIPGIQSPRAPVPPPARPSAPAAALPPRINMPSGIEEIIQQRLGQIQAPQTAKSMMDNPWMALVQGGLSMMDSRGKSLAEALAGGGRGALGVLGAQRERTESLEKERYAREMQRAELENKMRSTLGEQEYHRGSLEVQQRGQDIQARTQERIAARQERMQELRTEGERRQYAAMQERALREQLRPLQQRLTQQGQMMDPTERRLLESQIRGLENEIRSIIGMERPPINPTEAVPQQRMR